MSRDDYIQLCYMRRDLEKMVQLYEFLCADIAPPIKVLDGMPYSLTNAVNSMTEDKAVTLSAVKTNIDDTVERIRVTLGDLGRVKHDYVRQMIVLRFLCAYDWQTIKDKTNTDKTVNNIRNTVNYYVRNVL